jgi:hypothetical protein
LKNSRQPKVIIEFFVPSKAGRQVTGQAWAGAAAKNVLQNLRNAHASHPKRNAGASLKQSRRRPVAAGARA